MDLIRAFTEHPSSVGETYTEHMARAACFGGRMVGAGIACLVHAVFPFLFVRTGSRAIAELNESMTAGGRAPSNPIATTPRLPL